MVSPDYENPVENDEFDFPTAINELLKWRSIARNSWDENMFLDKQPPMNINTRDDRKIPYWRHIVIYNEVWDVYPWVPTQEDMFAMDWIILDNV